MTGRAAPGRGGREGAVPGLRRALTAPLRRALRRAAASLRGRPDAGLSWITPDLAVGEAGQPPQALLAQGVRAVLDVRAEACPDDLRALRAAGLEVLRLRVPEHVAPTAGQIRLGAGWARRRLLRGRPVLIQCRRGAGRSATLAVATLVVLGSTPFAAYGAVREGRPPARPSAAQMEAVLALHRTERRRPRPQTESPGEAP